jgi:hypothetical protein
LQPQHQLPASPRSVVCARMQKTGFAIWAHVFTSTEAEASRMLGVTDRTIRRYKRGGRRVPEAIAKQMTLTAVAYFHPEQSCDLFNIEPWPDLPDHALAVLEKISGMEWSVGPGNRLEPCEPQNADIWTASPEFLDTRTNGPPKSWFAWWRLTGPTR